MSDDEVISYSNIIITCITYVTEIILMLEFELFVSSLLVTYRIFGPDK